MEIVYRQTAHWILSIDCMSGWNTAMGRIYLSVCDKFNVDKIGPCIVFLVTVKEK